jgi:hypothetical protein
VRSLARAYTPTAINRLVGLCTQAKSESVQCQAAIALLERGWGKPPQSRTGEDGEGDIRVTIRHLIEDARGMVIEGKPEQLKLVNPSLTTDLASDGGG